ncbi:ABC transporter ATP-binding protein [Flavihumibacter petaseus]|uniref:Putative ABC transporter ATP-binding protein n=1 Tax=Flavihumibacter petaseus NBRC 106054 TaxID=1220578 RepID=A0A0E9MZQ1_9BACT|nr:ABC transporter ATP-binding protein [Flavihumibacter petaseus]GAO43237.1 putative ABC transporter ATP-binding protein [Flavihumibacter petaseus NBRC 106054]
MNFLRVSALSVNYREVPILQDVSFHQEPLERLAIAGETGSGKTTLLKAIGGLVTPAAGAVHFEGEKVLGPLERLIPGHPHIAYLSQHFELRNNYSVYDILEYTNRLSDDWLPRIIEICRVEHLLKRRTDQLSGGERQRVALARQLLTKPRLLLLDEPFSNLDGSHRDQLRLVIDEMEAALGVTCLMVSHDPYDSLSWASQLLVMERGYLVQRGRPAEIYERPANRYAARLFGKFNLLPAGGRLRFLRPEHMQLTDQQDDALPGRVVQARYYGSFWEWEVETTAGRLLVQTGKPDPGKGTGIHIRIDPQAPHHLVSSDF